VKYVNTEIFKVFNRITFSISAGYQGQQSQVLMTYISSFTLMGRTVQSNKKCVITIVLLRNISAKIKMYETYASDTSYNSEGKLIYLHRKFKHKPDFFSMQRFPLKTK
jgi:hypothetical protein